MPTYYNEEALNKLSQKILLALKAYILALEPEDRKYAPRLGSLQNIDIKNQHALITTIKEAIKTPEITAAFEQARSELDIVTEVVMQFHRLSISGEFAAVDTIREYTLGSHTYVDSNDHVRNAYTYYDISKQYPNQKGYETHAGISLKDSKDLIRTYGSNTPIRQHLKQIETISISSVMLEKAIKITTKNNRLDPPSYNEVQQNFALQEADLVKYFFALYRPGPLSYWSIHQKNATNTSFSEIISHAQGKHSTLFFGYKGTRSKQLLQEVFNIDVSNNKPVSELIEAGKKTFVMRKGF
jgi:hypothetical protein